MTSAARVSGGDIAHVANGRLYRLFWRWHFLAALLVVPFVLWQSVTGSLYLWSYVWMDGLHPELRFVVPDGPATPLSGQLAAAYAVDPTVSIDEVRVPDSADRSTTLLVRRGNGLVEPMFLDAYGAHVLGSLSAWSWLPGVTRNLHGGWPLGKAGSWLLELGACWAMVMIVSGLYLWWPRGTTWLRALWPRTTKGARIFWRDLHACIAAWFSLLILCFRFTAMPWTEFWGGQILRPVQQQLGQQNPAGFSPAVHRSAQWFLREVRSTASWPRRGKTASLGRCRFGLTHNRTAIGGFTMPIRRPGSIGTSLLTATPAKPSRSSAVRRTQ